VLLIILDLYVVFFSLNIIGRWVTMHNLR